MFRVPFQGSATKPKTYRNLRSFEIKNPTFRQSKFASLLCGFIDPTLLKYLRRTKSTWMTFQSLVLLQVLTVTVHYFWQKTKVDILLFSFRAHERSKRSQYRSSHAATKGNFRDLLLNKTICNHYLQGQCWRQIFQFFRKS